MGEYGAATFEDMMEDVVDVLVWINHNIATTKTSSSSSNKEEENKAATYAKCGAKHSSCMVVLEWPSVHFLVSYLTSKVNI